MTDLGDLLAADPIAGSDIDSTGAGSGDVLTADGAGASSFAAPAGGGGDWTQLDQVLVGAGGLATVTFTAIDQSFRDLKVYIYGAVEAATSHASVMTQFNNNSDANNYSWSNNAGAGASGTAGYLGEMIGASATDAASWIDFWIPSYTDSLWVHLTRSEFGYIHYGTSSDWQVNKLGWPVSDHTDRAAISEIDIFINGGGDFAEGSAFTLYGIGS